MALISCAECNAKISDQAASCPHCGHPRVVTAKAAAPAKSNHLSGKQVFWGIALGGGFLWLIALNNSDLSTPPPPDPKQVALQSVKLEPWNWTKAGFDNVMHLSGTISNKGARAVKDIQIECRHTANSGTKIDSNKRTIYEAIQPGKSYRLKDFSMGFIHSQANSTNCEIIDLVLL